MQERSPGHKRFGLTWVGGILVAVLALGALAACSSSKSPSSNGSGGGGGSSSGDYVIGAPIPLTGAQAESGTDILNAMKLAVKAVNDNGGVLGHKLVLNSQDTAADPNTAVAAANKLMSAKVDAIIGHYASGEALPCLPIYNRAGVPAILPDANSGTLISQGFKNLFLMDPTSDLQAGVGAKLLADNLKATNVLVVDDQSSFGTQLSGLVTDAFKQMSGVTSSKQSVPANQTDFAALIAVMKQKKVDAVYWSGYYSQAALLIKQMRDAGVTVPFVASDSNVDPSYITTAGQAAEGTFATIAMTSQFLSGADADAFKTSYKAAYGNDPGPYAAYGWDSVNTLVAAIQAANSTDKDKVVAALQTIKTTGLTGDISFGSDGSRQGAKFVVLKVVNGQYTVNPDQPS
ncbi:MAG: branched-chain amino acid ABC transporter substrate-binding protein [Actinomycetia bacterium]|nr:branched-chain amino acid ABC transporter substrate-binding protein [Actinomycetes bacterium]